MTNLRAFSDKGLDFIHQNMTDFFEAVKIHRENPSWIKEFCQKDPTISSPYNFDFEFEINALNPHEGEFHNAINLYELFLSNKIGNAVIYNEKFAAGFLYTFGYEYFMWASDLAQETRVSATFFFDYRNGLRQAIARQLMTRLYKIVDLTVESDKENKYELTKFVFDNPTLRRIAYYSNMDGYRASRCFVRAFKLWKEKNPDEQITNKLFEKIRKQFSAFANVNMVECVEEEYIVNYLLSCF